MERRKTNQVLGGLGMKDQGVQSPHTLFFEEFFLPSTPAKT